MKVVVVGGGAAGMTAASRVKRLARNAEVYVIEKTRWVSFALCGIPYYVSCMVKNIDSLLYYPLEEFTKRRGIRVLLESHVVDATDGVVWYRDRRGIEHKLEYDVLVLATGAEPVKPRIPGVDSNIVVTVGHLDDAIALRRRLEALGRGSRIVVVGAGLMGLELAEAILQWGHRVIVVEALRHPLPGILDDDIGGKLASMIARTDGVEWLFDRRVEAIEDKGRKARVILSDGEALEADLVVLAVGRRPSVGLARRLGLRLGVTGAVWVDETMRTSSDSVYAAGDVAETVDIVTGRRVWRPFAQVANKMGYVAGTNIAGRYLAFPGTTGTVVTKVFGVVVAKTGLSLNEAKKLGLKAESVTIEARTKAGYMGGEPITVKLVYSSDGLLLGAQALSSDESAFWRVNVVSVALQHHATLWDMFTADIGYMPALNPVWDPLIYAARVALHQLGGRR